MLTTIPRRALLRIVPGLLLLAAGRATAQQSHRTEIVPIIVHSQGINSIAISPDDSLAVTGSTDLSIKLWDVRSGRLVRTLTGHDGVVRAVAFTAEGNGIISASNDGTMRLWSLTDARTVRVIGDGKIEFDALAVVPLKNEAVVAHGDASLSLRNLTTGEVLKRFVGHSVRVHTLAISADGSTLASGGADGTVRIWDIKTGLQQVSLEVAAQHVYSVTFSPDGLTVALSHDGGAKLWNYKSGETSVLESSPRANSVRALAYSPSGGVVAGGSYGSASMGGVHLWNASTGKLIKSIDIPSSLGWVGSYTDAIAFSKDGRTLVTTHLDGLLRRFEVSEFRLIGIIGNGPMTQWGLTYDPLTKSMTSLVADGSISEWSLKSGVMLKRKPLGQSVASWEDAGRVDVRSISRHLALVRSSTAEYTLWDAQNNRVLKIFPSRPEFEKPLAILPDNRTVLSSMREGERQAWRIYLWDLQDGKEIGTLQGASDYPRALATTDRHVAGTLIVDNIERTAIWGASTGQLEQIVPEPLGGIEALEFSADGQLLIIGDREGDIRVWHQGEKKWRCKFKAHLGPISVIVRSATDGAFYTGSRIATYFDIGTGERSAKKWNLHTCVLMTEIHSYQGDILSIADTVEGVHLATVGADRTLNIWDSRNGRLRTTNMVAAAGQWVSLSPEGFFQSSMNGADDLLSIVRGREVFSLQQIHQSLFNPDLVREALAGDPDGEVQKAAEVINLEKVLDSGPAPAVAITSHSSGSQSSADLATLQARVTDRGKGIGRIEWRVNGITAAVTSKPQVDGPDYVISQELALDVGDNAIEVVAYNSSNLLASLAARTTIRFTGAADQTKPKLHVLAVGIDAYRSNIFSRLSFAGKDAKAFGAAMQQAAAGMYEEAHITYAIDEAATAAALDDTIRKLGRDVHPRDTFVLFVSGHGYSRNGRFYLIPQDYPDGMEAMDTRAIGQEKFQDWIVNHIKARKALILLDTCESGALVAGHTTSRINAPASEAAIGRLHEATGRPILTAAASGRAAFEAYKQQHGIFTYALLDALRNGDQNRNGTIELSELVTHVQAKVAEIGAELSAPTKGVVAMSGIQDQGQQLPGRGFAPLSNNSQPQQSARFGSRGEDFLLVRRLP